MRNGARNSGILKAKGRLNDDTVTRLKTSWNDFNSGIQNVGKTAVLEEGIEYQSLSLTSVDLEFLAGRNFQVADVARWWGVPLFKLGVMEKTSAKSMPEQNQEYVNGTIAPELDRWETRMEFTFDLEADSVLLDFDETQLLRADIMTRYNAARIGVLSSILTPNEARKTEGLPPKKGGDELLVPTNTAALGSDVSGTAADGAGRPGSGLLPAPGVPTDGTNITIGNAPAATDTPEED
jgi:HK97 family phage portal protein